MISPPRTTAAANGPPFPSRTFCEANSRTRLITDSFIADSAPTILSNWLTAPKHNHESHENRKHQKTNFSTRLDARLHSDIRARTQLVNAVDGHNIAQGL